MKRLILLISLTIFGNSIGMQDKLQLLSETSQPVVAQVKDRIWEKIDQTLLTIARQEDAQKITADLKNYYLHQPLSKTTHEAYIKKSIVNIQKVFACIPFLRTCSLQVRQQAEATLEPEAIAMAPVDPLAFSRAKEVWPLVSIQYELQEMADELDTIHTWAFAALSGWDQNYETLLKELSFLKNDREAVLRAIELCKQSSQN